MTQTNFVLKPFDSLTAPKITIGGTIQRQNNQLQIQYNIQGDTQSILWPQTANPPNRRFGLWEQTCLEFFIAQPDAQPYWEVNLSPSGDWNIYHLADYRQDLTEEAVYKSLAIACNDLSLSASLDLSPIVPVSSPIQLSITAVIQTQNTDYSYWAIAHTGQEPDFHLRESFVLQL
jgi:hypothetical protein